MHHLSLPHESIKLNGFLMFSGDREKGALGKNELKSSCFFAPNFRKDSCCVFESILKAIFEPKDLISFTVSLFQEITR